MPRAGTRTLAGDVAREFGVRGARDVDRGVTGTDLGDEAVLGGIEGSFLLRPGRADMVVV
eukprot:m.117177 g.117177  ORF g.117177 m.117177 type:complete len:60 (-) comp13624_c0_seq6:111-290(-)